MLYDEVLFACIIIFHRVIIFYLVNLSEFPFGCVMMMRKSCFERGNLTFFIQWMMQCIKQPISKSDWVLLWLLLLLLLHSGKVLTLPGWQKMLIILFHFMKKKLIILLHRPITNGMKIAWEAFFQTLKNYDRHFGSFPLFHPLVKFQIKAVQNLLTRILHGRKIVKDCSLVHADTF